MDGLLDWSQVYHAAASPLAGKQQGKILEKNV
jgi:hypothetical protein